MKDTPDAFEAEYRRLLDRKSPVERLLMGFDMFTAARAMSEAGLTSRDEGERRAELFERWYGDEFDEATRARIVERLKRGSGRERRG